MSLPEHIKYQKLFVGIILASFTHELRNHLAVVKETSGLQQDMISLDQTVKDMPGLVQTLLTIDAQVDNALQLIGFLNRFAHRMDSEAAYYNVAEVLDELMVLVSRLARQRLVTIETDFDAEIPPVVGDPANLQMLVFFLLDEKMRNLPRESSIGIRIRAAHGGAMIGIVSPGPLQEEEAVSRCPREILLSVAERMGAEIVDNAEEQEIGILLRGAW
jgi:nitrogen-specific signal transduction histidine kinase